METSPCFRGVLACFKLADPAKALEPPPPTTTPPSRCRTGFHYFPDTNKCYKVSGKRINFKTARDNCLGVPSRNPPELTSILSEAEMKMVHDLAYNIPNQGMFWIGLQLEDEEWKWTNGDFMNGTSYTNWATGYPREAPNSECVAYWMLSGWANTNCEDKYHAVCSYTPDLIQN
ncbi:lectin C-type domain protein [Ancylostoma ceylanicum]|uniref:Lectin C-type domain protein n=1 Tax=Ancylostoma ceylanicum TaxID=53326 RepID=A0A0D6LK91_9BILA|nr:lectin C-type domain protein [Ancylostoma ceylanicum]